MSIGRKGWKNALIRNRITVILLILVQIGLILYWVNSGSAWSEIIRDGLAVISFFAALYIIGKRGDPTAKLSWVFVVLLTPVFGGLLYLFYTFQYGQKWIKRVLVHAENTYRPSFYPDLSVLPVLEQTGHRALSLMRYLQEHCDFPVYAHTACTYLSPGDAYLAPLLAELNKAEKYIFVETFIIEEGEMWDAVMDVLTAKAAAGVDVRVLYDDVGCFLTLPKDYKKSLEEKGIRAQVFNPIRPSLAVIQNQRDHRKIITIDGKVAFTGGCNFADEYINAKVKHGHWKDAMVRVEGEAAWCLTLICMQLWDFRVTTEEIAALCPWQDTPCTVETDGYVQPYADNPLRPERIGENIYLHIISHAREYVYIDTPYLVLDDTMLRTLCFAAQSGVDVRIVVPNIPDHPLVQRTSRSYYAQLLEAGVKLYSYTPGFMHAKVFVSDDYVATVGTSNLDYRSLYQHFECGAVLYGCAAIADIKADYLDTLEACRRITEEDCRATQLQRLFQEILRLFAPLM